MAAAIDLSSKDLQVLCKRYLTEGPSRVAAPILEVLNCKWKVTSDEPAGFLGRHQFLTIEIAHGKKVGALDDQQREQQQQQQQHEKLHFFTKSAPLDIASRMEYLNEFGVFRKEIRVYQDVLPALQQISMQFAPQCFYADNNLLIFENLARQNFQMAAGRDGLLDTAHLSCALQSLAAMHAASIVHEARRARTIPQLYPDGVLENAYPPVMQSAQHVRQQNFDNAVLVMQQILREMPKYAGKLQRVLAAAPAKMARIFELAQPSAHYRNVFSHGDLWANNLMFRYEQHGDGDRSPVECRLVDFQLARYAPPLLDVLTLLTIPTTRQFRGLHLDALLAAYYRFLGEFLRREGMQVDVLLPEREFNACAAEYRICGLIESILFSHLTILPPALTQSLCGSADGFRDFFNRKRVAICMAAFRDDDVYRSRLSDMIEDFVDTFVLQETRV